MATQQLTLPMFPLNIVLLPGETKTLHIFEERYKQLISDCLENAANFGIPFQLQKVTGKFGVEVKINNIIKKHANGDLDIAVEAMRVFKIIDFTEVLTPKLYGAAIVEFEREMPSAPSHHLQDLAREYMWISQDKTIAIDAFDYSNVYDIARLLDLSSAEKYQLIKATTEYKKEDFLKPKIKLFIYLIKIENELKSKFVLN